jgi:hypothetical protein
MEVESWHFDGGAGATLSCRGALALGELLGEFVCL